jgi:hypothetical protein
MTSHHSKALTQEPHFPMAETKPIRLALKNADALSINNAPDETPLTTRFSPIAAAISEAYRAQFGGANLGAGDAIGLTAIVADFLEVSERLDFEYGADGVLPLEDLDEAADEALRAATELDAWLNRFARTDLCPTLHAVMLGIGLWAMRHSLTIFAAEPLVNALASRANEAGSKQETAAAFALMQGFIAHLAPQLGADLERSNPERAWRMLNLNFAITAIRTGDAALMRFAFDTLNKHLPDERAGFYEEAYALASQPGFPIETRALIETEHARWSPRH